MVPDLVTGELTPSNVAAVAICANGTRVAAGSPLEANPFPMVSILRQRSVVNGSTWAAVAENAENLQFGLVFPPGMETFSYDSRGYLYAASFGTIYALINTTTPTDPTRLIDTMRESPA
jgi:hypothetical protein